MAQAEETAETCLLVAAYICWTSLNKKTGLRGHNEPDAHLNFDDLDSLPKHVDDRSPRYPDRLDSDG